MHCFYCEERYVTEEIIRITGADVNHMKNVLRMRCGEAFTAADENGQFYHCEIETLEKDNFSKVYSFTR